MGYEPKPASSAQINLIQVLCRERVLSPEAARRVADRLSEPLDSAMAHTMIGYLKELPMKPGQQRSGWVDLPDVPAGHYAAIEDGAVKFFRVDRPTQGKWAGKTFLKHQHGPNYDRVGSMSRVKLVLDAIASNVEGSARLYGQMIGVCGICSSPLTNETSRRNGVGPICAAKHGIAYHEGIDTNVPVDAPVIASEAPVTAAQAIRQPRTETVAPGSLADNAMALLEKDGVKGVQMGGTTYTREQPAVAASTNNRRGGVKAPDSFEALIALRKEQK